MCKNETIKALKYYIFVVAIAEIYCAINLIEMRIEMENIGDYKCAGAQ